MYLDDIMRYQVMCAWYLGSRAHHHHLARHLLPLNIHAAPVPVDAIRVQRLEGPLIVHVKAIATVVHHTRSQLTAIACVPDAHT